MVTARVDSVSTQHQPLTHSTTSRGRQPRLQRGLSLGIARGIPSGMGMAVGDPGREFGHPAIARSGAALVEAALLRPPGREAAAEATHLAELYQRFFPAVHRRALSLLGDAEEALDVTQDTFLAYMRSESSLPGKASVFTVLYQIATYKAVDRLRSRLRWSGHLGPLVIEDGEAAPRWLGGALVDEGGMGRVEAVQELAVLTRGEPPLVLTSALLYFVEGRTFEEIGLVLDQSRKTISRLLRAFAARARRRSARFASGSSP